MPTTLIEQRENALLAPFAMHSIDSAGRKEAEKSHPYRSPYQRDRDRITHSSAFRRLSRKTQVFTRLPQKTDIVHPLGAGDYHRTRLTHTLEVTSIARTIGRTLRLNEDLIEALSLGHDVGHPPFGHAGEKVLDDLLKDHGGFNHNRQAVRIFEKLEHRYADRSGLNLTFEVLEGQQTRGEKAPREGATLQVNHEVDGRLLETQVVDAADSIAYDAHDADDALEVGLISLAELNELALWRESVTRVKSRHAAISDKDLRLATIHELIDRQVSDLLDQTSARLLEQGIESTETIRRSPTLAVHSNELSEQKYELESFLFRQVYRHPSVLELRSIATEALQTLFHRNLDNPDLIPDDFSKACHTEPPERQICDFLASLTDDAVLSAG